MNAGTVCVKATTAEYFAQAVYDRVEELDNTLVSLRLVVRFLGEKCKAT